MTSSIQLVGRMLNFSTIVIKSNDTAVLENDLKQHIAGKALQFAIPVVVDFAEPADVTSVFNILRTYNLQPIGVLESPHFDAQQYADVAVFPRGRAIKRISESVTKTVQTQVHNGMLRSGQSLANPEGDLVITSDVNVGAEAIASGNLHIYGKGQGSLVAGASGESNATIFCQVFDPALVSVAGTYCSRADIAEELLGKPVLVSYKKDSGLHFTLMNMRVQ